MRSVENLAHKFSSNTIDALLGCSTCFSFGQNLLLSEEENKKKGLQVFSSCQVLLQNKYIIYIKFVCKIDLNCTEIFHIHSTFFLPSLYTS